MSSADVHDVTGGRPGDRASSVPVPGGVTFQDEPDRAGTDVVRPDLADVESVLRAVAELTGMPAALADPHGEPGRSFLRRQPVRIVAGRIEGGYASAFEVICCDCGDNPNLGYSEAAPRLQRLRGPYPLHEGVAAYEAHLARTTHGVGDGPV